MASYKNLFWQNLVLNHEVRNIAVNGIEDMLNLRFVSPDSKIEISNGSRVGDIFHVVNDWPFGQDMKHVYRLFNGMYAVMVNRHYHHTADIAVDVRPAAMFQPDETILVKETGDLYRVGAGETPDVTTPGGTPLIRKIRPDILPAATLDQTIEGERNDVAVTPYTFSRASLGYVEASKNWAQSPNSPDGLPDSKSSKSWAEEAQATVDGFIPSLNATAYPITHDEAPEVNFDPDTRTFEFAIPAGPQGIQGIQGPRGEAGTGVSIKGTLNDPAELPSVGEDGDAYLIAGSLWVWDGADWNDVGNIQGPQGVPGQDGEEVDIRVAGGFIQWRRGDDIWTSLISVSSLMGAQGYTGSRGIAGTNGREIEVSSSATHIRWRFVGDVAWNNLVALADLRGPQGYTGSQGTAGREVEIRVFNGNIEWRRTGDLLWEVLTPVSALRGDIGYTGSRGSDGSNGQNIELRNNGSNIQWRLIGTAEWQNLVSVASLLGYTGSRGYTGSGVELQIASEVLQWKPTGAPSWTDLIDLNELAPASGMVQHVIMASAGTSQLLVDTSGNDVRVMTGVATVYKHGMAPLLPMHDYTIGSNGIISLNAALADDTLFMVEYVARTTTETQAQALLDNYRNVVADVLQDKVDLAEAEADRATVAKDIAEAGLWLKQWTVVATSGQTRLETDHEGVSIEAYGRKCTVSINGFTISETEYTVGEDLVPVMNRGLNTGDVVLVTTFPRITYTDTQGIVLDAQAEANRAAGYADILQEALVEDQLLLTVVDGQTVYIVDDEGTELSLASKASIVSLMPFGPLRMGEDIRVTSAGGLELLQSFAPGSKLLIHRRMMKPPSDAEAILNVFEDRVRDDADRAEAAAHIAEDVVGGLDTLQLLVDAAEGWAEDAQEAASNAVTDANAQIMPNVVAAEAARDEAIAELGKSVRHDAAQTLTSGQQQRARQNIGLTSGATAATSLGITSSGSTAVGSYIDIQVGAEKWRFLSGSVAQIPDQYGEFGITYGFSFLTAPHPVVSNGGGEVVKDIILSTRSPEVGGFWVAARSFSGGGGFGGVVYSVPYLGEFRVNFSVFGRIA